MPLYHYRTFPGMKAIPHNAIWLISPWMAIRYDTIEEFNVDSKAEY